MSTKLLTVGSEVRMSAVGKAQYCDEPYNPHSKEGRVIANYQKSAWVYRVEWETGAYNNYKIDEIELLNPAEESFESMLEDVVQKRVQEVQKVLDDEARSIDRLRGILETFKVLELGVDEIESGDFFVYTLQDGTLDFGFSDTNQTHPDDDGDYSYDGGYLDKYSVKVAFRAEGLTGSMLTDEMLKALVKQYGPEKAIPKDVMKALRSFGSTSGVEFVNKLRKTRNKDMPEILAALDELFK